MQPHSDRAEVPPLPPTAAESTPPTPPTLARRWIAARRWRWGVAFLVGLLIVTALCWPQLAPLGNWVVAKHAVGQARQRQQADDLPGALESLDRAIELVPADLEQIGLRALWRMETGDLEGALADLNDLIEKNPHFGDSYRLRSQVLYLLQRHDESLADADRFVELRPAWDPEPLNNRAYLRANIGRDLEAALADVERALDLLDPRDKTQDYVRMNYLDTQAFILHRLGRHQEALADMERALTLAEEYFAAITRRTTLGPYEARKKSELFAVLHHHRGLVLRKLERHDEAQRDLTRARRLGYDPARGVY